jgi:hypothetical protein
VNERIRLTFLNGGNDPERAAATSALDAFFTHERAFGYLDITLTMESGKWRVNTALLHPSSASIGDSYIAGPTDHTVVVTTALRAATIPVYVELTKQQREAAVFRAFRNAEPLFAGETIVNWTQPQDPKDWPDVTASLSSGRKVGVEMGEWLHEKETGAAITRERHADSVLAAIRDQGGNPLKNIAHVWVRPSKKVADKDAPAFREQFLACVSSADNHWPYAQFWNTYTLREEKLVAYPALQRYVEEIQMFPRARFKDWPPTPWVSVPPHADSYSPDTMLSSLLRLLREKRAHYSSTGTGFDHLSLLLYYDRAALYNSPVEAMNWTIDDVADVVRKALDSNPAPFDSIYLFFAVEDGRAFKVG